jgi:uncharacterized protein YjlB
MERQVEAHLLRDDGFIPNNQHLPLVVFRQALERSAVSARAFEAMFQRNGWDGAWRNGVYDFHHYHSSAHEVLGVYSGSARVMFGGERGVAVELKAGDVVVIPAGVGHRNLGASSDFAVVGAYPRGQDADLCRGGAGERAAALQRIREVSLPEGDPLDGKGGRLFDSWK